MRTVYKKDNIYKEDLLNLLSWYKDNYEEFCIHINQDNYIPERILNNAKKNYIKNITKSELVAIIDSVVYGEESNGFAITIEGLYFSTKPNKLVKWSQISDIFEDEDTIVLTTYNGKYKIKNDFGIDTSDIVFLLADIMVRFIYIPIVTEEEMYQKETFEKYGENLLDLYIATSYKELTIYIKAFAWYEYAYTDEGSKDYSFDELIDELNQCFNQTVFDKDILLRKKIFIVFKYLRLYGVLIDDYEYLVEKGEFNKISEKFLISFEIDYLISYISEYIAFEDEFIHCYLLRNKKIEKYQKIIPLVKKVLQKIDLNEYLDNYFIDELIIGLICIKDFNLAIDMSNKLDDLDIIDDYGRFLRGICFILIGDNNKALESFLSIEEKDEEDYYFISKIYLEWNNYKKAKEYIELSLKEINKDSSDIIKKIIKELKEEIDNKEQLLVKVISNKVEVVDGEEIWDERRGLNVCSIEENLSKIPELLEDIKNESIIEVKFEGDKKHYKTLKRYLDEYGNENDIKFILHKG